MFKNKTCVYEYNFCFCKDNKARCSNSGTSRGRGAVEEDYQALGLP
jgi:hypothetical protein